MTRVFEILENYNLCTSRYENDTLEEYINIPNISLADDVIVFDDVMIEMSLLDKCFSLLKDNIITALYTIVGTVLNILILLVLCSGDPADSRSPTSLYLTHMAFVDLLFVLTVPYVKLQYDITLSWSREINKLLCIWKVTTRQLNMCVSIFMLTFLSIDRYVAIVMSTNRSRFYNITRKLRKSMTVLNLVCLFAWLCGIVLSYPVIKRIRYKDRICGTHWGNPIGCPSDPEIEAQFNLSELECTIFVQKNAETIISQLTENSFNECACSSTSAYQKYRITLVIFGFLLPLFIITFCYMSIACVLRESKTTSASGPRKCNYRAKATMLIFVMVMAYITFWTPFHLYQISVAYGIFLPMKQCILFENISRRMCNLHAVLNPIIYSFLSYGYRNRLIKLFSRAKRKLVCMKCVFWSTELLHSRSTTQTEGSGNSVVSFVKVQLVKSLDTIRNKFGDDSEELAQNSKNTTDATAYSKVIE